MIKSSLGELTEQERTIQLFLDDIPDDQKSRFEFDDFQCDPSDCCVLDYAVLDDLRPDAVANDTEVELIRKTSPGGKNVL